MIVFGLLGYLNFDREFFFIGRGGHIAIQDEMPVVIGLIVDDVDTRPFGIKDNLGIPLKADLLCIVFIQVELEALDFLCSG